MEPDFSTLECNQPAGNVVVYGQVFIPENRVVMVQDGQRRNLLVEFEEEETFKKFLAIFENDNTAPVIIQAAKPWFYDKQKQKCLLVPRASLLAQGGGPNRRFTWYIQTMTSLLKWEGPVGDAKERVEFVTIVMPYIWKCKTAINNNPYMMTKFNTVSGPIVIQLWLRDGENDIPKLTQAQVEEFGGKVVSLTNVDLKYINDVLAISGTAWTVILPQNAMYHGVFDLLEDDARPVDAPAQVGFDWSQVASPEKPLQVNPPASEVNEHEWVGDEHLVDLPRKSTRMRKSHDKSKSPSPSPGKKKILQAKQYDNSPMASPPKKVKTTSESSPVTVKESNTMKVWKAVGQEVDEGARVRTTEEGEGIVQARKGRFATVIFDNGEVGLVPLERLEMEDI